jgi:prephenate dehydrogenase
VGDGAQRLTGGSFRDGTRVAESDPSLWAGILTDNLEPVLAAIDAYTEWLGGLRARLAQGDGAGLQEELMEARISRRWFRHE